MSPSRCLIELEVGDQWSALGNSFPLDVEISYAVLFFYFSHGANFFVLSRNADV